MTVERTIGGSTTHLEEEVIRLGAEVASLRDRLRAGRETLLKTATESERDLWRRLEAGEEEAVRLRTEIVGLRAQREADRRTIHSLRDQLHGVSLPIRSAGPRDDPAEDGR